MSSQRGALDDRRAIPLRPVLLLEQQQPTVRVASRRAARVGEQNQCQQSGDIGAVRQQRAQHAREVERPLDEIAAHEVGTGGSGVPGGEQQMYDGQHGVDAFR